MLHDQLSLKVNHKSLVFFQKFIYLCFRENAMTNAAAISAYGGRHYSDEVCVPRVI
jgi:hypothetical protein